MPSDSTYEIGMLANSSAYVSDTLGGSGHLKVTVAPEDVKVDFVRAYLPADEVSGTHHNREVAFSYSVGGSPETGMNESIDSRTINIYPNPAKDQLSVSLPEGTGDFRIRLTNMVGQIMLESNTENIDLSSLKSGIYLLNLYSQKYNLNKKIIIE